MEFKELEGFSEEVVRLVSDAEFSALQAELLAQPEKGKLILPQEHAGGFDSETNQMGQENGRGHQGWETVMAKKNALDKQLEKSARSLKAYAAGKAALQTTILVPSGGRAVFMETLPEAKARRERLARFKAMRSDLELTQPEMAAALQVSTNTLKGWEAGKPIPEIAFVLAQLLHDMPAVRKRLLAA